MTGPPPPPPLAAGRASPPNRRAMLREALRYIGPGFLVTMGFIDPGNWASNVAAGSRFGYALLWIVTASTILLGVLQHAAARLGIASGLCLSESATRYFPRLLSRALLATALAVTAATAFAELLGAAIGLQMLTGLPLGWGSTLAALTVACLLLTSHYRRLERYTVGFVSLVGFAFLFELGLTEVSWREVGVGLVLPRLPEGSLATVLAVLGAVVMPHGIYLHSEVVQSRSWAAAESGDPEERRLVFEVADTTAAMIVGWAINAAMVVVAAAVFHAHATPVTQLSQAHAALSPALGRAAAVVFALGLVVAGVASSLTSGMAGGAILAGARGRAFATSERVSRIGMLVVIAAALGLVAFVHDAFEALLWSQVALSVQLPLTIAALVALTSSRRVMGAYASPVWQRVLLWAAAAVVVALDLSLLWDAARG